MTKRRKTRHNTAQIAFCAGRYFGKDYWTGKVLCTGTRFRDVLYRLRKRGYFVQLSGNMYNLVGPTLPPFEVKQ